MRALFGHLVMADAAGLSLDEVLVRLGSGPVDPNGFCTGTAEADCRVVGVQLVTVYGPE